MNEPANHRGRKTWGYADAMGETIRPDPVAYPEVELSWMVGRSIAEVTFHEPQLWYFTFGSDAGVGVECLWRIVDRGRIVLTSEDHDQQFGLPAPVDAVRRATELLARRVVTAVHLREATADLTLSFTDDVRLEILPVSSGYESWQFRTPTGAQYFATGGGHISVWNG